MGLLRNDPTAISNIITDTINAALDKKFEQLNLEKKFDDFRAELKAENEKINTENQVLRKAIVEQQKCLERLHNDSVKANVFVSGIPVTLATDGRELNTPVDIIHHILKYVAPEITKNDYKILHTFEPRDGADRYSAKLSFFQSRTEKSYNDQ